MFSQTDLDNYILSIQCKIGTKASTLATAQMIGNNSNNDRIKFIFAVIGYEILIDHDINETCLTNDDICKLVTFYNRLFKRDCNC